MAAAPRPVGKQARKAPEQEKKETVNSERFRRQFHKTRLCVFHQKGQCKYGAACSFAHEESKVNEMPDLTKTSLCRKWMEGKCPLTAAECSFAHGKRELKMTAEYSKRTAEKPPAQTAALPNTSKVQVPGLVSSQIQGAADVNMVQMFQDRLDLLSPSMQAFEDRLDLATMLGLKMSMQTVDGSSAASTTANPDDITSTRSCSEEDVIFSKANESVPPSPFKRAMYDMDPVKLPPPGLDTCLPMKVTLSSESCFGGYFSPQHASPFGLDSGRIQNDHSFGVDSRETFAFRL